MKQFVPLCLCLIFAACSGSKPHITAIDPHIGIVGQMLTIMGEHFGTEQDESFVTIGGVTPTQSSYRKWSDTMIVISVPDFGESGLLYVNCGNQKSNPVLFSIKDAMPIFADNTTLDIPVIRQLRPVAAGVGQLLTIYGSGFGKKDDGSAVCFTWGAEGSSVVPEAALPQLFFVNTEDNLYEAWDDKEIRVYVPDGAADGIVEVRRGLNVSNAMPFDLAGKPGIKTINNKKTYSLAYSVDVRVDKAHTPALLYLWVPQPVNSASQVRKELLSSSDNAFIPNYQGVSLFRFSGIQNNFSKQISVSYLVDVWTTETTVESGAIRRNIGGTTNPFVKTWLLPSALIPSDIEAVKEFAASIKADNPYLKARALYRAMMQQFTIKAAPQPGGAIGALQTKTADSYSAALLYCALCRASGIPAVPVAGILVDTARQAVPHYWVEFWIDNFGSVPVDPALGAGAAPSSFNLKENYADYYFGNLDNQHIAFSHGEINLSQIDAKGRGSSRERTYSLQNMWEEASGGLEAYSTHWSDIVVTGVYSN